jgi:hypothetical protein
VWAGGWGVHFTRVAEDRRDLYIDSQLHHHPTTMKALQRRRGGEEGMFDIIDGEHMFSSFTSSPSSTLHPFVA